jgi:hypothetical protein
MCRDARLLVAVGAIGVAAYLYRELLARYVVPTHDYTVGAEHVWPKTWNSGRAPSVTVSGPRSNSSSEARTFSVRFACVSSAPLGVLVVPDV